MEPILVIMAAGMGSRYGGAKQIDPVDQCGNVIMDYSFYDAYQAGFRRAIFVIKRDFDKAFREHIDSRSGRFYEVNYAYQELSDVPEGYEVPESREKPWGTGHAVLAARALIDAPFAVINADDYYGKQGFAEIYDFLMNEADATHHCMVGFNVENTLSDNGTVARGVCAERGGMLVDIQEHLEVGYQEIAGEKVITGIDPDGNKHVIPCGTPVSMNLWGFGAQFIESMWAQFREAIGRILQENPCKGEFYLPTCIDNDVKSGKASVKLLKSDDKWFGMTYRQDKELVKSKLKEMRAEGIYPENLW